jgi:hypothetical protein
MGGVVKAVRLAPHGCIDPARNCASEKAMSGDRTEKALARIDLALGRIAAAQGRAEAAALARTRHNERLKQAIAETLRDLDGLIHAADPSEGGGA